MLAQSSSPDAHRNTAGANPALTPTGMPRWRARWCGGHRLRHPDELLELPPDPGPAAQETARDVRVTRARFLQQRRAHRRRFGQVEIGEQAAQHRLRHQQLVVVAQSGHQPALGLEATLPHGAELLQHLDHAEELLPVRAAQ